MSEFDEKKIQEAEAEGMPADPLAGSFPDPGAPDFPSGDPKKPKKTKKSRKKDHIVRIGTLEEEITEDPSEEIDSNNVVSLYIPHRRMRMLGAALLRVSKLYWILAAALALIIILFLAALSQEKMGNFTINLNRLELYRKGIAISADRYFTDPTARLAASALVNATNISQDMLPDGLGDIDGDHNGKNYVAYTYYVRNGGKENVDYVAQLVLENASKGVEEAIRVMVIANGVPVVYAEPAANGEAEKGTVKFEERDVVITIPRNDFLIGYVDKYTVVIWLEGDDPECVDRIIGGSIQFSMNIDAADEDNTSLFRKFVQDIRDSLTGNQAINAAGTEAPEYYLNNEITWDNRRNQENAPAP